MERERQRERQTDRQGRRRRKLATFEVNKHAYLTFTMNYSTDPTVTSLQKVTDQVCSRL